jgi:hypothetical protein
VLDFEVVAWLGPQVSSNAVQNLDEPEFLKLRGLNLMDGLNYGIGGVCTAKRIDLDSRIIEACGEVYDNRNTEQRIESEGDEGTEREHPKEIMTSHSRNEACY